MRNNCTSCQGAHRLSWSSDHSCMYNYLLKYLSCQPGYYDNQTMDCAVCSYQCATCLVNEFNCKSCRGTNRHPWAISHECGCINGYYDIGV